MYSSVIPWMKVFCDWLLLVCSFVSLETAPNLRLFVNVAISWGRTFDSGEDWIFCNFFQLEKWQMWGFEMKDKLQSFTVKGQKGVNTNNTKFYNNKISFISAIYTSSLAEKLNQEKQMGKSTLIKLTTKENADSGGKQTHFHPSLSSWATSFPSFDRKCACLFHQRWTSTCLFPRRHNKSYYKHNIKR